MDMPTDRGYAVISRNDDGTVNVRVSTAVERGQPRGVYAEYARAASVRVDPAVHLARAGTYRYTTSVVEVSSSGTSVVVRAPKNALPS
jgi:hypothetical protein